MEAAVWEGMLEVEEGHSRIRLPVDPGSFLNLVRDAEPQLVDATGITHVQEGLNRVQESLVILFRARHWERGVEQTADGLCRKKRLSLR